MRLAMVSDRTAVANSSALETAVVKRAADIDTSASALEAGGDSFLRVAGEKQNI